MKRILAALLLTVFALAGLVPAGSAQAASFDASNIPVMPTFAPVPTAPPLPTFEPTEPMRTPVPIPTFAPVPTMPPPPSFARQAEPEPQTGPVALRASLTADAALEKALYAGDQADVTYLTASPDGRIVVGYVLGQLALFYPEAGGYVRVRFDEARNAAMGDMKRAREYYWLLDDGTVHQSRLKGVEHAAWSQDGRYVVLSNLMMSLQLLSTPQGVYYIDTANATLVCARNEAGAQGMLFSDTLTYFSAFSGGHTLWSQRWHAGSDADMVSIDLDTLEESKPIALPAIIEQPMLSILGGMAYWPSMNWRAAQAPFDGIYALNLGTGQVTKTAFEQGRALGLFDIHPITKRGILHGFRGVDQPTLTRFRLLDDGAFEGLDTFVVLEDLTGTPRAREVAVGEDLTGPVINYVQLTADGHCALIAARPTAADALVMLLMDLETLTVARVDMDGGALDALPQGIDIQGAFQYKSESGFECFADGLVILNGRLYRLTMDA